MGLLFVTELRLT